MILTAVKRFMWEEDGPTAVEYAVMLMLIFLAVVATVQFLGNTVEGSFTDSSDKINAATGS